MIIITSSNHHHHHLVLLGFEEDWEHSKHEHCSCEETQQGTWKPQDDDDEGGDGDDEDDDDEDEDDEDEDDENDIDTDIVTYDFVHESENLWTIVLFITHLSEVQKVFVQTPARSKFTQIE